MLNPSHVRREQFGPRLNLHLDEAALRTSLDITQLPPFLPPEAYLPIA